MSEQSQINSAFFEPGSEISLPATLKTLAIEETPPDRIVLLSGDGGEAELPVVSCVSVTRPGCVVFGLAPNRWLVVYDDNEGSLDEFSSTRIFASDHTDAWAVMTVSGGTALEVFQALCPVDMRRFSFSDEHCFQSHIAGSHVLVCKDDLKKGFRIFVPRSSGRAVLENVYSMAERV